MLQLRGGYYPQIAIFFVLAKKKLVQIKSINPQLPSAGSADHPQIWV